MSSIETMQTKGGAPASPCARVILCDDDSQLRELLSAFLSGQGYDVVTVADGHELTRHLQSDAAVDLIILDVMLPGQSGIDICQKLRGSSNVPILMLTARGDEADRIAGLEMGADDYVSKPFSPNELLARVKALMRRASMAGPAERTAQKYVHEFEGWRLDILRHELRNPTGVIIDLSSGEHDLLVAFLEAPQRILSREQLLDAVGNRDANAFDRSIDVQVSRLRRKIDDGQDGGSFIKTVRGAGYMFLPAVRQK